MRPNILACRSFVVVVGKTVTFVYQQKHDWGDNLNKDSDIPDVRDRYASEL